MPKLVGKDFNIQTGNVSSVTVVLPPHQEGDVILVFAGKDDATGTDPTTATAGWAIGAQGASSGATTAAVRCGWFIKRANSNAEPDIVITSSDSDSWSIVAATFRGVGGTTKSITNASWAGSVATYTSAGHGYSTNQIVAIYGITPSGYNVTGKITGTTTDTFTVAMTSNPGSYTSGGTVRRITDAYNTSGTTDSTGAPFNVPGVTTGADHSLVVFMSASGGTGCPVHYPGITLVDAVDSANEGVAMAYTVKAAAGATGGWNFYTDATNTNTIGFCCSLLDDGTGQRAAYWDTDYATLIHPFRGNAAIITSDVWGTALTNYPTAGKDAVAYCVQADQSGGPSYVDQTSAANSGTDGDVTPFPATEAAGAEGTGDWFAIGYSKPFRAITIDTGGATAGAAGAVAWEYWNGAAWVALTSVTDGTTGFTAVAADNLQIRWAMPPNFNWRTRSINGSDELFFVRARCTTLYTTNPTLSQVYVSGASLLYDAVGSSGDAGVIQYENASNITPATSTVQIAGTYIDLGSAVSLAGCIVCGTYQFSLPRDYVDAARMKEGGGIFVMFSEGASNYNRKTWCVGSFLDSETSDAQRNRFAIDWEQATDTTMGRTTTDPSDTIADVFVGGLFPRGAGSVAFSHMAAIAAANAVINGGSSTAPISNDEFIALGNASPLQLFRDWKPTIPFILGGSDDVHIALDGFTMEFPGVATPWSDPYNNSPRSQAHYDAGTLGVTINAQADDTVSLTNGKITSASKWKFDFASTASGSATYDFTNLLVDNANVTLRTVHTFTGITFQDCTTFTQNGATIQNCIFLDSTVSSASPGDADNISDCAFTSSGTGHAITIAGTAADMTLDGVAFTGYAGTDGSSGNEAIYVDIASGSMTISITGGGSTPSIRTAGATVTVVNAVTVRVTAKDADTQAAIQSARVLLQASSGATVTITRSGSTATVAHTAHGYSTGQKVVIAGANQGEYNGLRSITVADADSYTYSVSGSPATPATGTITSYRVILDAATDASGIVEDAAFAYTSNLAVTGRVRKGGTHKTAPLSGTITSAGLDITAFMVSDA